MFDLTYSMLAAYTASDYYEQRNEAERYRNLNETPEALYVSLFRDGHLADLVSSGLYKAVCASIAEVTNAPDYYYDNIVTLLLCPEYPQTPRRFLKLIGTYGVPVEEFQSISVSTIEAMCDYAASDTNQVIQSLFGIDVQVNTGYTKQLEMFVTDVLPTLRNGLREPALCAVIRRFLHRDNVLCLKIQNNWLQFDMYQFLRSTNLETVYVLSTMLTQTKRSSKYGDTELKCGKDGHVVNADGSAATRSVLVGHVLGNLGLVYDRLSHAEPIHLVQFSDKYWEYKDCPLVSVGKVRVRKGSRLALENDAYEVLVTVKAKEPVITIHVRGTDTVLTTNLGYWEAPKPVDKVEELQQVLSEYITDAEKLSECISRVMECKGWRK